MRHLLILSQRVILVACALSFVGGASAEPPPVAVTSLLGQRPEDGAGPQRYTRQELEGMARDRLIEIILDLQEGSGSHHGNVVRFDPFSGSARPRLLVRYEHPGYNDHGTLSWPNGRVFMMRHINYGDDKTLYYPNGQTMLYRHLNYNDDYHVYWPNGRDLALRHSNYGDDGTIYRPDGQVMLLRHRNYNDDRQRTGIPFAIHREAGFSVSVSLASNDGAQVVTTVSGEGWTIRVSFNSVTPENVQVQEAIHQ